MNKILVIEDNSDIRQEITSLLKFEDYEVLDANNGETGVEIAREWHPDLIICDIMMPGMDGHQVIQKLKNNKETFMIPFVFLTARTAKQDYRKCMDLGADDYLTKPFSIDELISSVKTRLDKYNKYLQVLENEKALARVDYLTGVSNRRGFNESLEIELSRARREKKELSVAYIDVDNFKKLNDEYGHDEGDRLLKELTKIIRDNIRDIDLLSRIGGDEFIIILQNTDKAGVQIVIERIMQSVALMTEKNNWPCSISVGVGIFNNPDFSIDTIIKEVDALMYKIKHNGKNGVIYKEYKASSGVLHAEQSIA